MSERMPCLVFPSRVRDQSGRKFTLQSNPFGWRIDANALITIRMNRHPPMSGLFAGPEGRLGPDPFVLQQPDCQRAH